MTVKKFFTNYQARADGVLDLLKKYHADQLSTNDDSDDSHKKIEHIKTGLERLREFLVTTVPLSIQEPVYMDSRQLAMIPWRIFLIHDRFQEWQGMDYIFRDRYSPNSRKMSLGALWLYQDSLYEVSGAYSLDEEKLLILEYVDRERKKFEKLQNKFSDKNSDDVKYERTRISEEVRITVWRRDQGKCARCGSRENLEYDHIVPVSKGGSNTARNIELLCQNCNRSKGNRID